MRCRPFWIAGVVLALSAGCAPPPAPPVDTAADVAAIDELASREIAAFAAGDAETIKSIFATDALVMPPNEPAIQGHQALEAWLTAMGEQVELSASYSSVETVVSGDLAVQRVTGEITMTPKAGGDAMTETMKGLHVLRKQADGSWKIVQDIWNIDQPMPGGGD